MAAACQTAPSISESDIPQSLFDFLSAFFIGTALTSESFREHGAKFHRW
jgi:hypothetical protein